MNESHYIDADVSGIFLGDIYYAVVPFRLREPIWVIIPQFSQRRATLQTLDRMPQAFRDVRKDNTEFILGEAKLRPVLVLSRNQVCQHHGIREVFVAPVYTLDQDVANSERIERIRRDADVSKFYLPKQPPYMDNESYANFSALQTIAKDLLVVENKRARLSDQRLRKMYELFATFLSTQFVGVRYV
jgi:hypothetical protein